MNIVYFSMFWFWVINQVLDLSCCTLNVSDLQSNWAKSEEAEVGIDVSTAEIRKSGEVTKTKLPAVKASSQASQLFHALHRYLMHIATIYWNPTFSTRIMHEFVDHNMSPIVILLNNMIRLRGFKTMGLTYISSGAFWFTLLILTWCNCSYISFV